MAFRAMSGTNYLRAGLLGCAGFAVLCGGLVCVATLHKSPSAVVTPTAQVQPESAAVPVAAPVSPSPRSDVVAKVGDTIRFSDSLWSVVRVEDLGATVKSNNQFQPALKSDGGKFIRIAVKVTNLEKQEERLFDAPKVEDAQGREFKPVDMGVFYIPEGKKTFQLEAMPPSLAREFWEVYEVAGDSTGLRFMARELSIAAHTHPVDLGLK